MLEQIDLERSLAKRAYTERITDLQTRLFSMEQALIGTRIPVLILFEGWAGTAKARTIGVMVRRLDPRGIRVHSITPPRTSETQYPWLYRFWLKLPSYGQIAIFDRSWYREMLSEHHANGDNPLWRQRCEDAVNFERQLADDGAIIIKFWLHISRKEQHRRFKALLKNKLTAYQVTKEDRKQQRNYSDYAALVEDLIARTGSPRAPWHVIPATDKYYARVAVISTVLAALEPHLGAQAAVLDPRQAHSGPDAAGGGFRRRHLEQLTSAAPLAPAPPTPFYEPIRAEVAHILRRVDLSVRLDPSEYTTLRRRLQAQLHLLGLALYHQHRPAILVFEGWDAAGKGGAIQRLTAEIDPRSYTVHAIAAPAGEDKIRHYLYRFWRRLPPRGQLAIFDRSWYGRVLVERIEGFAQPDEWQRAYAEINEFERQLVDFGAIICKFWLHLSPEEQLRRFEERKNVPFKAWKLTDEDWRNREKWPQYEEAVDEMLLRSSTPAAPWTIVEAESKHFARIKVLRTVVQRLEAELGKVEL
ncbi:MAG: hypothetical protein EI684_12825 [Candidatus Viridilinea halotolerans]|uniref:Polyphosphate kinase-2-related domain-containing protein n=1 Tax=Candidatus Viridilinea halotolerans TaxID=2491704 RepID=A0A426TYA2_9CHLR|nr:MAG: hypothetical protein EI684_12825 [Candidatus Viridilinea halotolerans]